MKILSYNFSRKWLIGIKLQTFQLSRFDRETPSMRHLPPVPRYYIQLSRLAKLARTDPDSHSKVCRLDLSESLGLAPWLAWLVILLLTDMQRNLII